MRYNSNAPCLIAVTLALSLTGVRGQGEDCAFKTKYRNGTAGGTLSFQTGLTELAENNHILWFFLKTKETLIYLSQGEIMQGPPERFERRLQLNNTTGSLTIQPLSFSDSGIYRGEIFNKNNKKICYEFNLTVEKAAVPGRNTAENGRNTAENGRNAAADQRSNHLAVLAASALAVFLVLFV